MTPLSQPTSSISPMRDYFLRGACYFFLVIGFLSLGYAGFVFVDSQAYQAIEMKKFKQAGPLSEPHSLAEDDVIGEIQVPRLGINVIVVQGDSPSNLRRAVGHISKSALPGAWGNVVLAGHRDTFFRPLRDIRLGDEIRFETPERSFDYLVESIKIVAPSDLQVLEPSTGHDLTLLTCFPFYYLGHAPKRFVVHAREIDGTPLKELAEGNDVKSADGQPSFH